MHIKLRYSSGSPASEPASRKKKGKCKEGEDDLEVQASQQDRLATLDIFAGCGGLSEGLQQSGISIILCSVYFFINFVYLIIPISRALDDWLLMSNTAGVSSTKWSIEYEEPAGEAFKLNHPESLMFINNCNVILR